MKNGGHKYALDAITVIGDSAASTATRTGKQGLVCHLGFLLILNL